VHICITPVWNNDLEKLFEMEALLPSDLHPSLPHSMLGRCMAKGPCFCYVCVRVCVSVVPWTICACICNLKVYDPHYTSITSNFEIS
jgi:hypothetical protein